MSETTIRMNVSQLSRRGFLKAASGLACSAWGLEGTSAQTFRVGAIPVGRTTVENGRSEVLSYCDELAQLGFHRFEVNNTRAGIAEYYAGRIAEFNAQMAQRRLALAGLAQYGRAGRQDNLPSLLEQHMLIGRFLAAVGGGYIAHMLATGEVLNEGDEETYRGLDVKVWAKNLNEIGKRLHDEYGIRLGYHPLRPEVSSSLYKSVLDQTDQRYVSLVADIGHLVAGGANPIAVCSVYRSRLVAVHLKDFSPRASGVKGVKPGNVAFGQGVVDLPGVIAALRRTGFSGWVMGESGGTNQAMRDYMAGSLQLAL